ncbi:contact-dependent growth inhibition system immunity protein [Xanthomonas oryzae]|uniref:contact-dependent growth inhibition system immunity protein n=1 Tax=Xanthomonas oryzae TaxID=347 RepID=UPI001034684E|nr:contact-dependent growth inhibition system immunity protein [Xanthomonas oryzae]QBH01548.1 hypothetical protein EYC56_22790 [Xanthomonas oryzae]
MKKNLDALGQLLGCYFHQDWVDEFGDDLSAIQAIIDSEPHAQVLAAIREIDELLADGLPENELSTVLIQDAGCYFEPRSLGLTREEWLKRVRSRLAQAG